MRQACQVRGGMMDNTLSDYDLIDRMKKERQNEIDKLRAENSQLRNEIEQLKEAIDTAHAVYDNLLSDYQILKKMSKND